MLGQLETQAETATDTEDPDNVMRFPVERTGTYREYLQSLEGQATRDAIIARPSTGAVSVTLATARCPPRTTIESVVSAQMT